MDRTERRIPGSHRALAAVLALALLLSACLPPGWEQTGGGGAGLSVRGLEQLPPPAVSTLTASPDPLLTAEASTPSPTPDRRLPPERWMDWPAVPAVSAGMLARYQAAADAGADPRRFSVVGDCQSEPNVFLGIYATDRYWLGDYAYLQEAVDFYAGSFDHYSASVRDGLSAPSALSPMWADPNQCQEGESPVACELRLHEPALVFVNLGTVWREDASPEVYRRYLRQIVEQVLASNALPVLLTKADNVEGDHAINLVTAQTAYEYDLPLINVWLAVQDLPGQGLDGDRGGQYLTPDGWDRRNFTALRALHNLMSAYQSGAPLPAPTLIP